MESAKSSYERICNAVDNLNFLIGNAKTEAMREAEQEKAKELDGFTKRFDEAMDDDINTADAFAAVFDLVRFANSEVKEDSSKAFAQAVKDEILMLGDILGMIFEKKAEVLDSEIEALIEERQAARKAKNFARADEIRDQLAGMGITLLDTREGVKWKRS
jgi:cysteinyl-tRNA synthetase